MHSQPAAEKRVPGNPFQVLEIGFGTGLNALLTCLEAENTGNCVVYTTLEPFPLPEAVAVSLNYPEILGLAETRDFFGRIHAASWNIAVEITPRFTIKKCKCGISDWIPDQSEYDLVYFDAFSPDACPELWSPDVFGSLAAVMREGGLLVTYSVKGTVVRALKDAGFDTEKLPGPVGKRHILRAIRRENQG